MSGQHEILITSENISGCALMLCAIVEKMVNGFVVLNNRSVLINMRERGSELLLSGDDISEDMFAGKRAGRFSLCKAADDPSSVPYEAECSLCSGGEYYGRVRFRCAAYDDIRDMERTDAVILITDGSGEGNIPAFPRGVGIAAALLCEKPSDIAAGLPEKLSPLTFRRRFYCGYYDPFGFTADGLRHSPDGAEPYGVEEIFWHAVRFAAETRYKSLGDVVASSRKMIERRCGVFSADSIRNYMELENARAEYSAAARSAYSSQRLMELTRGYGDT